MGWQDRSYYREGRDRSFFAGGKPVATLWIVGINVAVMAIVWTLGGGFNGSGTRNVIDALALLPNKFFGFEIWRYVTYGVIHGNVGHLFYNVLMIFFIGMILEQRFGSRRLAKIFVALIVFSGLGYVFEKLVVDGNLYGPACLGASGGAIGLVALLGSRFPKLEILFFGVIPLRCWALAAILVGLDVLNILAYRGADGTAHSVHLAGALGGFAYGFAWPRVAGWREQITQTRERSRAERAQKRDATDSVELDRVLEKIKTQGMDKLTERERRFLLSQSEKLKGGGRR